MKIQNMNSPSFSAATVEEMHNGIVRIRGNGLVVSKIGKTTFLIFSVFGCVAALFVFFMNLQMEGVTGLKFAFAELAFIFLFFNLFGLFCYFLLTYGVYLLRVVTGYHKLWWDDFTYDGVTVKSMRYKFDSSNISFVESGIQKFPENDSWHYASIMNSSGIEIGRVMVVYRDKKKMVKYLSDLFGVS